MIGGCRFCNGNANVKDVELTDSSGNKIEFTMCSKCRDNFVRELNRSLATTSSRKPIKSSYYDGPTNHPQGGGTCDYCHREIAPGDGYEQDFESTREAARRALIKALGGDNE